MYTKLKYIILTILIFGIGFGIFSYLNLVDNGYQTEFYLPTILVGLVIVFFFLARSLKIKSRLLTFSALGIATICLIITVDLTLNHFSIERYKNTLTEYHELSCEQMKERYAVDLKKNELKYFSGGFTGTGNLTKNLKKYDIQNFDLGCTIYGNLMCYSELVAEYLKKKESIEIAQLIE
ncbi:hypothetical protein [uncultured Aquimarina sp.]|uniref:hypothetical protein n=1 Tax=uncultured Aquimarina sp. TaxID=575652 RepID=UPI00262103C6|nr:hypothetical protein [uncultured Aquimarina sp.]